MIGVTVLEFPTAGTPIVTAMAINTRGIANLIVRVAPALICHSGHSTLWPGRLLLSADVGLEFSKESCQDVGGSKNQDATAKFDPADPADLFWNYKEILV